MKLKNENTNDVNKENSNKTYLKSSDKNNSIKNIENENNNIINNGNSIKQDKKTKRQIFSIFQDLYTGFSTNLLYALPSDWLKFLAYEFIAQCIFAINVGAGNALHKLNYVILNLVFLVIDYFSI